MIKTMADYLEKNEEDMCILIKKLDDDFQVKVLSRQGSLHQKTSLAFDVDYNELLCCRVTELSDCINTIKERKERGV